MLVVLASSKHTDLFLLFRFLVRYTGHPWTTPTGRVHAVLVPLADLDAYQPIPSLIDARKWRLGASRYVV